MEGVSPSFGFALCIKQSLPVKSSVLGFSGIGKYGIMVNNEQEADYRGEVIR